MMQVPAEKAASYFAAIFQELGRLEVDCKILGQWAEDRNFPPMKTLSLLIGDSLESLELRLSDFKRLLQKV